VPRLPAFERIIADPSQSFRCGTHDFPCDIARWNYHPECEIHLIRRSSGRVFVGDYIGSFGPGHLAFINSGMPHNWVTDLAPGETVRERDLVLQFDPALLPQIATALPEMRHFLPMLAAFEHSWEFDGAAAREGARLLEEINVSAGPSRVGKFLQLIHILAASKERMRLASVGYKPILDEQSADLVHRAMSFILRELSNGLRLDDIAAELGMSASSFSRFFKRHTGHNFIDYVRKLRIGRACDHLSETDLPVTQICFLAGYLNLSNFNRNFRIERGMTPKAYRRMARRPG
jgi:AraC-like DNA-binding protein